MRLTSEMYFLYFFFFLCYLSYICVCVNLFFLPYFYLHVYELIVYERCCSCGMLGLFVFVSVSDCCLLIFIIDFQLYTTV